jgi:RNA polymerase-binding transcription factor DksA
MPAPKRATKPAATSTKAAKAAPAGKKAPLAAKASPAKASTSKAAPKAAANATAKTVDKADKKVAKSIEKTTPKPTKASAAKSGGSKTTTSATAAAATKAKAPAAKAAKVPSAKTADDKKAPATTMPAKSVPSKSPKTDTKADKSTNGAEAKSAFDKKFLDEQRALLLEERAKYQRSAQLLKDEADALVLEREPGDVQFDEESGEGDTLAVERDFDLALSAQARQQVEEIDAALERIDNGTYGLCRVSGKPIPKERLQAIPWATERVEYKVGGLGRR